MRSTSEEKQGARVQHGRDNDSETFVLGDDEDEEDEGSRSAAGARPTSPPHETKAAEDAQPDSSPSPSDAARPQSPTYYIKSRDTVTGIALKHGIDVRFFPFAMLNISEFFSSPQPRQLCRLNKLPISTLTTTPHLLHTRTTLELPPGARAPSPPPPDLQERLEARARERAGRAFQAVTKETDWCVAQTYVALLDVSDEEVKEGKRRMVDVKSKEGRQALAVDSYLDDNAWEEEQRRAGLEPKIEGFPYFSLKGKENVEPQKEEGGSGSGSQWLKSLWPGSSK